MEEKIFSKINQISVLASEIRFKILLALFNSEVLKLGEHSHSFEQIQQIVGIGKTNLIYHLDVLKSTNLIEKVKECRGYYHISGSGKQILNMFGVNRKLVDQENRKI